MKNLQVFFHAPRLPFSTDSRKVARFDGYGFLSCFVIGAHHRHASMPRLFHNAVEINQNQPIICRMLELADYPQLVFLNYLAPKISMADSSIL